MFLNMTLPRLSGRVEAPITATDLGAKSASNASLDRPLRAMAPLYSARGRSCLQALNLTRKEEQGIIFNVSTIVESLEEVSAVIKLIAPKQTVQSDVCEIKYADEKRVKKIQKEMIRDEVALDLAEAFKVLSDPTRVKIIFALSKAELCVCDLSALLSMQDSAVSHHLRLLRALKLVKYRKEGRIVYYSLDDAHIEELFKQGLEHVQEEAGPQH